jgi:protein tyrosine/serine phosphatase
MLVFRHIKNHFFSSCKNKDNNNKLTYFRANDDICNTKFDRSNLDILQWIKSVILRSETPLQYMLFLEHII